MCNQNLFVVVIFFILFIFSQTSFLYGAESKKAHEKNENTEQRYSYSDSDCLTLNDQYLEGYIQCQIDQQFTSYSIRVLVRNRYAYLYRLPKDDLMKAAVIRMVSKTPGILGVKVKDGVEPPEVKKVACAPYPGKKPRIKGIWFPQNTVLFPPLIASPRAMLNSISYRWQWGEASEWLGKNAVAVSFGDIFPLYRFIDIGKIHAKLQFSLEAAAWSIFRIDHQEPNDWSEFVNVDFLLGIPITMAIGNWSGRLRGYHTSTHLGDELLVNNPGLVRLNPSYEGVDLYIAYQVKENLRPYIGIGRIFRSDNSYPMGPLYVEYGCEYRFLRQVVHYNRLYGQAFVAVDFLNDETRHWALDFTAVAGYEWSKLRGAGRRFRIYVEWHNGFASDGQFYKERLSYFGFKIAYGF